ncbi:hypothetical protein TWF281_007041 [Arthrobotrys megalospora]
MGRGTAKAFMGISGGQAGPARPGSSALSERRQPMGQWRLETPATSSRPSPSSTQLTLRAETESRDSNSDEMTSIGFKKTTAKYFSPANYHGVPVKVSTWDGARKDWDPCEGDELKLFLWKSGICIESVLDPKDSESAKPKEKLYLLLASLSWRLPEAGCRFYLEELVPQLVQAGNMTKAGHTMLYLNVSNGGYLRKLRENDIPWNVRQYSIYAFNSLCAIQKRVTEHTSLPPRSTWIRMELSQEPSTRGGPLDVVFWRESFYTLTKKSVLPCGGEYPFLFGANGINGLNRSAGRGGYKTIEVDDNDGTITSRSLLSEDISRSHRKGDSRRPGTKPTSAGIRTSVAAEPVLIDVSPRQNSETSHLALENPGNPLTPTIQTNAPGDEHTVKKERLRSKLSDIDQTIAFFQPLFQEKWAVIKELDEMENQEASMAGRAAHLLD